MGAALSPVAQYAEAQRSAEPYVRIDPRGRTIVELLVKGAHCANCIRKIESGLLASPGVEDARLNLSTGRLSIAWTGEPSRADDFVAQLSALGFDAVGFSPGLDAERADAKGRALLLRLAVSGFAAMNIMMFSVPVWTSFGEMGDSTRALMYWLSAIIAFPSALYAGQPFFASAWSALKARRANMDVPISIAVLLTLAMSLYETASGGLHAYFDGVLMLLFLLLIGRYLDHRLREHARTAARDLLAMQAATAQRIDADGVLRPVAAADIEPGDRLHLAPGDRAPVDGIVASGASELDCAILTGETAPIAVRPGDALNAGALNLTRALEMQATRRCADSTIAELARLIELGEQKRARRMRIIDKAAALYVPLVHGLALAVFAGWMIANGDVRLALTNAVAVLIITCPCALGLAAPAVQVVATGRLFLKGVFVKSGDALERLAEIDTVVLDKTGVLTFGRPTLVGTPGPADLACAAQLSRASRHPLSRALVHAAGVGPVAANVIEHPGQGLEGEIGGVHAKLGSRAFIAPDEPPLAHANAELWFQRGDEAPVHFVFQDRLRDDAPAVIAALQQRGLSVELLSGDRDAAVAGAARDAGIDNWRAGVSPTGKVARLDALAAEGRKVLMIGDGLNDAAALAAAHVSAAPGTAIDASQAASDLVFQSVNLAPLIEALDVARAAKRRVMENLWFSGLYNALAIPFAALGLLTPLIAAIAMSSSSLIVSVNALRIAGKRSWIS